MMKFDTLGNIMKTYEKSFSYNLIKRYFSLPNELIDYCNFCKLCENIISEYELWKVIHKKKMWNTAQELFEAMNDKRTLHKCLSVIEKGNKGLNKYISGKDVQRVTGLKTDKRIEKIINVVNQKIFYGDDKNIEFLINEVYSNIN